MRTPRPILRAALAAALALTAALVSRPCHGRGSGGFLREWVVAAPFEHTDLDRPELPEDFVAYPGLFAPDRVWLLLEADEDGKLDLRARFPEPPTGLALAHTFFRVPKDGTYVLRVGSDDSVRLDVDGRPVHKEDTHRAWRADQDEVRVELAKGWHRLLARVGEYGAQWALSVRVADAKNRPLDLENRVDVPPDLRDAARLGEPVPLEERARVAVYLAREAARMRPDLDAARRRLAAQPEGYVTFAEYAGARKLGLQFLEALAGLWDAIRTEEIDAEALRAAEDEAMETAGALAPGLVDETRALVHAMGDAGRVQQRLGRVHLKRGELAEATAKMAILVARSRILADRVLSEHLLMARLENDIRNYRQRNLTVRVVDVEGGPVENAEVEIVQTHHDFLFGANLFAFRRWGDQKRDSEYEKRFSRLFNFATVPVYWNAIEKPPGDPDTRALEAMLEWAARHRIAVRAHPLLWADTLPRRVERMKATEARKALENHVREVVGRFRGQVAWWDVLVDPDPEGHFGPARIDLTDPFHWAAQARPAGRLALVGSDASALALLAKRIREAKAPLDAVAVAAHQHDGAWPLEMVRKTLDRAASAGLPVHVAAVTILGSQAGEKAQAEAVRRFYTAAFAHPKVASITWWDLSDRYAWQEAPGGLLRADLSPKPAYKALQRLILELWRTDAAGRTDARGRLTVRAFEGHYRITARQASRRRTIELHLDDRDSIEVTLPAAR